jgi:D-alanyl-D-alanine carboxypeptidase
MGPAKTGWTVASRHTYACAVTRNGRELLLTLRDSPNKWLDAEILFNWGFAQRSSPRSAVDSDPSASPQDASLIPASNVYQRTGP